jgi:hypothetical protein
MEVKRYYIVSYILYIINPTAQKLIRGPGGSMRKVVGSNNSYKPIPNMEWVHTRLCKLQKGCTRLAVEILLKMALNHKKSNQKLITLIITF